MDENRLLLGKSWDEFYSVETESSEGGLSWHALKPPFCHEYSPSSLRAFHALMCLVQTDFVDDVFIDFGSGKGRIILGAQEYPLKRIIGVELQESLCCIARSNYHSWRGRRVCNSVEIVCRDAVEYEIPADAAIFYMYNPFRGQVLKSVIDRIVDSINKYPRRGWLLVNNYKHLENLNVSRSRLRLIDVPQDEKHCGLFEIGAK